MQLLAAGGRSVYSNCQLGLWDTAQLGGGIPWGDLWAQLLPMVTLLLPVVTLTLSRKGHFFTDKQLGDYNGSSWSSQGTLQVGI